MADGNDAVYADLLDSLSPLTKAGIDPDDARMDRAGTMDKLLGPAEPAPWYEAQNDVPPRPGSSPNGNALPPGLNSRVQAPQDAPEADGPDAPATTPTGQTIPVGTARRIATDPSGTSTNAPDAAPVPAGVTPSGNATVAPPKPSWADLQRQNVTSGMASLDKSDQALQTMQNQPDLASTTKNLEAQRQNQAQPLPAYDPQTGKLLSEYKPTVGQRLARGVEGFARAGILGAVDPKIGGGEAYGAPNSAYQREVQQRGGRVASLDQQIKNAADNWKATSDRAKATATDRRANADARGKISTEITGQEGIPIRQQEADAQTQNAATNATKEADKPDATPKTYEQAVIAANQEADPVKKAQLMAAADQIQKAEVKRFSASAPRGPASIPNGTGDTTKAGADYLSTLPAGRASLVKEIGEGRGAPPNSRSRDGLALMADVTQAYPDYDATKYPTYQKTRQAFTSGAEGKGINSFNTALQHLDRLESHLPDNTSLPAANWVINLARKGSGSSSLKPFETDALAVSNEVERAYKGGALSEGDYNHMRELLNENDSPKAMKASIRELRGLLQGKLDSYQQQWESAMPAGAVSPLKTIAGKGTGGNGGFNWDDHPVVK